MKIKILAIVQNLGALAQIRILSPLKYLKAEGLVDYQVLDMSQKKPPKIKYIPDIVLHQRNDSFLFLDLIKLLKSKGSKIIYELDDDLLRLPKKNVAYSYYENPHIRRGLLENIWVSDHLIVTNGQLQKYYWQHNKSVSIIPNFIDTGIFPPGQKKKELNRPLRIGYAGTMTHLEDFEQVVNALKKIKNKYKNEVKLAFINFIPPEFLEDPSIEFIPGSPDLHEFAKILANANFDIGLAPLKFNEFNKSKSDIKFLEYSINKIAGVYSNYKPYENTVKNNVNGLSVNSESSKEWFEKISFLIENPSKIIEYGEKAFDYVSNFRTMEKNAGRWYETFEMLLNKDTKTSAVSNFNEDKPAREGVSVIVVTYNSAGTVSRLIASLKKTISTKDEVIFVDNCSKDNTAAIIKKSIKNLNNFILIKNKKNTGFSAGCNTGIRNSRNKYVVLLNPDTVVAGNWIEKMLRAFKDEKVAAAGPLSNYVAGLQNVSLYLDEKELQNTSPRELNVLLEKKYTDDFIDTKLLIGFCMMIKKSVLNKLGLLDEKLFLGNDDLELSWRFRENRYRIVVAKNTFVFHEGQRSFKTVKKSVTDKLVQESTNALYEKLKEYYGETKVPTPQELWGINWFTPENAVFKKGKQIEPELVSIVIPVYNHFDYTKQCLDSIIEFTGCEYEIIVVDNGSTDGTPEKLKSYEKVKIIRNENNEGFPKAVNQGINAARGNYILILNNDVIVTDGWLERMVEVAQSSQSTGIVGPLSNSVSGVQLDKNAKYESIEQMHSYAARLAIKNKGKVLEFPRVAFLCTLIKKDVINKIGGLDERFSPGNFEDDDFCLRAQIAGFKTVIAQDVFVHHFGSVSFKENGEDEYARRLEVNKQKFIGKWGAGPEGIWLRGEKIKNRNIKYPVHQNAFVQFVERAFVDIENEEIEFAIENLNNAIEKYGDSENEGYKNVSLEDLYVLKGKLFVSQGNLPGAQESYEAALKTNPASSQACAGLGEIFYLSEMYQEAKTMYEWAVVNDVENAEAKRGLEEVNKILGLPGDHNTVILEVETVENSQSQIED